MYLVFSAIVTLHKPYRPTYDFGITILFILFIGNKCGYVSGYVFNSVVYMTCFSLQLFRHNDIAYTHSHGGRPALRIYACAETIYIYIIIVNYTYTAIKQVRKLI